MNITESTGLAPTCAGSPKLPRRINILASWNGGFEGCSGKYQKIILPLTTGPCDRQLPAFVKFVGVRCQPGDYTKLASNLLDTSKSGLHELLQSAESKEIPDPGQSSHGP